MCVILQVRKWGLLCEDCQSWESWEGFFCPVFKWIYEYLALLHLQNQFLILPKKKREDLALLLEMQEPLPSVAVWPSLWVVVYWCAVPFPHTLKDKSKAKISLWGQWQINLPSSILRKIGAAGYVGALLLCQSYVCFGEWRFLWVLAIFWSRHCAKLQHLSMYQLSMSE